MGASVMLGLSAAGAVSGAMGAYSNARSQKAQLEYQAQVAANNARLAEMQAAQVLEVGAAAENAQQLKTAQMFADQRAALAANGVDLGSGSANEILATTKFMGERDVATIRDNALRQAWGYKVNAANSMADANAASASARSINPRSAALNSLLSGSTRVASSWYGLRRAGVDFPRGTDYRGDM